MAFGVDNEDYLLTDDGVDWGSIGVTHNTYQYPTQLGVSESSTVIGTRDISITGWIIGNTVKEIESKKAILSKEVNPLQKVRITANGYFIEGSPSSNVVYGKTLSENNEVMCKFLLNIFCPYPLFRTATAVEVPIADTLGKFGFPLVIPKNTGVIMGLRKKSLFTDLVNDGAVSVGLVITLEATGTVNNPEIVNVSTKEVIKINKVLCSGEKVVINTSEGERSVIGKIDYEEERSYFGYFDYDNDWMQLPLGISTFTFKSRDSEGFEDETYKKLNVTISYRSALYNLGGE